MRTAGAGEVVCRLRGDATDAHDVLPRTGHDASFASAVAAFRVGDGAAGGGEAAGWEVAVDELLLGEGDELACGDGVGAFERARRGERPAPLRKRE